MSNILQKTAIQMIYDNLNLYNSGSEFKQWLIDNKQTLLDINSAQIKRAFLAGELNQMTGETIDVELYFIKQHGEQL